MKPVISSLSAFTIMILLTAPTASALSCSQQAAQLQERQTAAQDLAETRSTLAEDVEAAGDAWENAEAMRNFSAEQAAEADATKATYETLKADLMQQETSLQTLVVSLNQEVTDYNKKCVRN